MTTNGTQPAASDDDMLEIAGLRLRSRVLLGTARYPSTQVLLDSLQASGTQLVTTALRRGRRGSRFGTTVPVFRPRNANVCSTASTASPAAKPASST